MRVAIVGSRDYPDIDHVLAYVRLLPPESVVVSGGARGVDEAAEAAALECGHRVESIAADWKNRGRRAGPERNAKVVERADRVVAFWDGKSRGTLDTIRKAVAAGKQCAVKRPGQAWEMASRGWLEHRGKGREA